MTSVRPIRSRVPRAIAAAAALLLGLGGALVVASPAAAAVDSFIVNNASDDVAVPNSFAWAIAKAESDPDHTDITFDAGAGGLIVTDLPPITTDVSIAGPGSATLTIQGEMAGGVVFDVSGAGPVSIGGLTIAPAAAGSGSAIVSSAAALTLVDIDATGFSSTNIAVTAGSFTGSAIVANLSATDAGFVYFGSPGDVLTLSDVEANGNATYGTALHINGSNSTATDLRTQGNGTAGVAASALNSGSLTLDLLTATGNLGYGISLDAEVGSTIDLNDSLASDNDSVGVFAVSDGSAITATGVTASDNEADGFVLGGIAATFSLIDSISSGNGVGCGCGGPGVSVLADSSAVTIAGTTISDNTAALGAGVYVQFLGTGSTLGISNSTISGNHAMDGGDGAGGGIAVGDPFGGSGLGDDSTITVSDSSISGNDAELEGGGVALYDLGAGSPTGSVTFLRTTIDGNTVTGASCGCSTAGGGILLAGAQANSAGGPVLSIQQSTISNNTVVNGDGGGLYLAQGPGYSTALVDILGSTISGNSADGDGGAAYLDALAADPGTFQVAFRHSTIAGNTITGGGTGGLFVDQVNLELTLDSTIVAGNDNDDLSFDPAIGLFAARFALIQNPAGAGIPLDPAQGNLTGVDPKLGALANNGGTTRTMLIAPSSPAYNAGNPAFTAPPTTDQRGLPRVYQVIDIGAVEWQPALAYTGQTVTPGPSLVGLLLLLCGIAMVTFSRLQLVRSALH